MTSGSASTARIRSSTLREVAHFGLCQMVTATAASRAGGAAHVDAGAVAAGDLRVDPAQHQDPPVERDDLAVVLVAARLVGGADVILAAGPALEAQLLRLRLVGEMHHHAAARPQADDVGLAALADR